VGRVAKPGDPASFAERIDEYFESEELRKHLVQAVDRAAKAYSWDYFVGQLEACYENTR